MAAVPWEFPEALNVGPIRFGDLRRFWGALLAISNTHDMAHLIAMGGVPVEMADREHRCDPII